MTVQILETVSESSYDMIPRLQTKSNKTIQYGQMRMVLFGSDYAKKGIGPILGSFSRDSKITSRLQMGVTDKEASEMLAATIKSHDSLFLMNMIEKNTESGNLPRLNFHTILYSYYGAGRDFFLPYFVTERDLIKLDGIALFKEDKWVATVGIREVFIVKMLTENSRNGSFMIPLRGSDSEQYDYVLMRSISSKASYRVISSDSTPAVSISIKIKASVKDIPDSVRLKSRQDLSLLEHKLEEKLRKETEDFISLCHSKKVDPLGFGDLFRSKSRSWNEEQFQAAYSMMKVTIKFDLDIIQTGIGK
jgi:Ger(x)C family germination protein